MLIQIALLAWVFLGERISPVEGLGMLAAALGTAMVQIRSPDEADDCGDTE